jgi:hypothetical protein
VPATATSSCPKCGTPRDDAVACPKCGLLAAKMATFSSNLDSAVPDVARTAWERALAQWEDPAAHDELLRLTTLHGCYAWAAARYRERRGEAGPPFREIGDARDPIAERQLERIRRAAEVALLTSGAPRPERAAKDYRSAKLLLGVVIIMIIIGLAYALYREMSTSTSPPPPATHRPRPQLTTPASQVR